MSSFAGPTPDTASTSSHDRKPPSSPRSFTSALANVGPTPGMSASSSAVASLRFSLAPSVIIGPAGARPVALPEVHEATHIVPASIQRTLSTGQVRAGAALGHRIRSATPTPTQMMPSAASQCVRDKLARRRHRLHAIEPEGSVKRAHRKLGVVGMDEARNFDLRGGDHLDVDAFLGEHLEHLRRDPRVVAHPDAD